EISADQAKNAAGHRRNVEQQAGPRIEFGRSGPEISELEQRRGDNQRQHQDVVRVERKSDRRNEADGPLHWGEAGSLRSVRRVRNLGGISHRDCLLQSRRAVTLVDSREIATFYEFPGSMPQ